jgi:hypothetical protein
MALRQSWRTWTITLITASLILSGMSMAYAAPPQDKAQQNSTPPPVFATVTVERAIVFPQPDRATEALTYLYERERVPVYGQSPDRAFLFVPVGNLWGWILAAQVDIEGDLTAVPVITEPEPIATPTLTITPFQASPVPTVGSTFPTRTPLPTQTPAAITPDSDDNISAGDSNSGPGSAPAASSGDADTETMPLLPGVPPPIAITLPENWHALHGVVPFRTFDGQLHDAPLSIYFGELAPGVNGFIYLYWGFPNTVDYITGEYNLWADGVQILRGSLVGETCNLGVYDQQTFEVGGVEGIGANYQAADCEEEQDTAGWFSVMRVQDGTFAFYTAVEPWEARAVYRDTLQAILDSVVFFPPEDQ